MQRVLPVLSACLVVVVALSAHAASAAGKVHKPKPTPSPVQYGLVVRVAIMPPQHATKEQRDKLLPLADAIRNDSNLYLPWVYDSGKCKWDKCTVSDADIIVTTALQAQGVLFDSFDVRDNRAIGAASADSLDDVGKIQKADVQKLLGTPKIDGSTVITDAQFVQYVLIVPQTANDAPYLALVQHLLGRQGLVAFPSQYTYASINGVGDVTSICSHGERYFVYTVNTTTGAKKWIGFTRIAANANGFLADCVTHTAYRFSTESTRSVPTSSATFTGLAQILKLGFLPHFDWGDIGTATTAVASFADVDPSSSDVQYPVVETALQKSVDLMCEVISHPVRRQPEQAKNGTFESVTAKNINVQNLTAQTLNGQPLPQPSASPVVGPFAAIAQPSGTSQSAAGATTPATGTAAPAAGPQLAFNIGAMLGPQPFPLACSGPRINVAPTPRPSGAGIFGSFSDGNR